MATKTLGALAALEQVREWALAEFGPPPAGEDPRPDHRSRLEQLDSALKTAAMAVEHLVDEDARERHLMGRLGAEPAVRDKHGHQARPWLDENGYSLVEGGGGQFAGHAAIVGTN